MTPASPSSTSKRGSAGSRQERPLKSSLPPPSRASAIHAIKSSVHLEFHRLEKLPLAVEGVHPPFAGQPLIDYLLAVGPPSFSLDRQLVFTYLCVVPVPDMLDGRLPAASRGQA